MNKVAHAFNTLRALMALPTRLLEKGGPRIVIYTCIFGKYEPIKEPLFYDPSLEFILFTDNPNLKTKSWAIQLVPTDGDNPRRISRKPKILPHRYLPKHDISIYLDGTLELRSGNVYRLARACLGDKAIALFRHYKRNCTYAEGSHCVAVGKEHPDIVERQLARYKREGLPRAYGLFENAFIVRRNTSQIQELNELWWQEYSSGSQRDQLSLMYCLWRLGLEANVIRGKQFRRCSFLRHHPHDYITYLDDTETRTADAS